LAHPSASLKHHACRRHDYSWCFRSRAIHSRMYGEQRTIFTPSALHAPKNRTTSTSTTVTSFKSKTNRGPLSWSCFFNSPTCSD
jgi:hypothetical protein